MTDVKLTVYNVAGEVVSKLVDGKLNSGLHSYKFNAENLNSGIYFYNLEVNGVNESRRMVLLK